LANQGVKIVSSPPSHRIDVALTGWDVKALAARARGLVGSDADRAILGIAGPPGAGKSTLAAALANQLTDMAAVVLPMDGFHLSNSQLSVRGMQGEKGSIDTFDAEGYLALLRRVKSQRSSTVYAPAFHRDLDEAIAGSIAIEPTAKLVITEGNYLLVDRDPWRQVRALLTEAWFVDAPDVVRLPQLIRRHEVHGRTPADAERWALTTDEVNARLVRGERLPTDLVVYVAEGA
jgi:pantothenate kinase